MKKRIAILGSTGSIGTQALDVIRKQKDFFEVELLTAHSNCDLLIEQAKEFLPNTVVISDKEKYLVLKESLSSLPIKVFAGADECLGKEIRFKRSEVGVHFTGGRNKHPGWLCRHFEVGENVAGLVVHRAEGDAVLRDKTLHLLLGAVPRHTDDGDFVRPGLLCHLDRGGFSVANASRRCPKPERHRFTSERRGVELSTANKRRAELQDRNRLSARCCAASAGRHRGGARGRRGSSARDDAGGSRWGRWHRGI